MTDVKLSETGLVAGATTPATVTPSAPVVRRWRPVLLAVVAGLALGGLVGQMLGPRELSLGPLTSGDQLLAGDFRATLANDRGLASVQVARLRDGQVT